MRLPLSRRAKLIGAAGSLAAAPALALAVALAPCDCPLHTGPGTTPHAGHTAMAMGPAKVTRASAGDGSHAEHGRADTQDGAGWEVGTPTFPLVARGVRGPLAIDRRPAGMDHGTPESRYVAARLEARRLSGVRDPQQRLRLQLGLAAVPATDGDEPVATRAAVLTTAQATKKLSAKCRKLLKAKRPSKLSKADRRRRTACQKQRGKLIADSAKPATSTPATAPAAAPAPATAGTTARTTPAPASAATPVPTAAPTAAPSPTPAPATGVCAGKNPCYAAVGVQALDSDVAFALSRATVQADIVSFQLENKDRQTHNLYIAPVDSAGEINGSITKIVGDLAAGGVSDGVNMRLAPGRYKLICVVTGHSPMAVGFTVQAPVR
ncbi:MAG: hypothetical protein PGN13_01780 [Patulibacter minatonensis]